jgi:hypothetical protein
MISWVDRDTISLLSYSLQLLSLLWNVSLFSHRTPILSLAEHASMFVKLIAYGSEDFANSIIA